MGSKERDHPDTARRRVREYLNDDRKPSPVPLEDCPWCGKKFRPERVQARAGWNAVPAVRDGELHEIKSAEILQPGPAALTDGVRRIQAIISKWAEKRCAP